MLQGKRVIREYAYSLKSLGNTRIRCDRQGIRVFPKISREYAYSLNFRGCQYTNSLNALGNMRNEQFEVKMKVKPLKIKK